MQRRQFLTLLTAAGASTLLAACDDMPPAAVQPWTGPSPDLPDLRQWVLSWALLAPNPHNLQSWIADIREPGTIVLHVDGSRLLPQTDPPGRQIMIGCGAFLELLALAAAARGHRADITLFPQVEPAGRIDERPVALVRLVAQPGAVPDTLLAHARARRTNRQAYADQPLQALHVQALAQQALLHQVRLAASTGREQAAALGGLALQGYRVEFGTPRTWRESVDVMRLGSAEVAAEPSGIALVGTLLWWARKLGLLSRDALQDPTGPAAAQALAELAPVLTTGTPTWLWLSAGHQRSDHIAVGRAYMRVCLQATAMGLALHPNSQVLQEFAEMQPLYQKLHAVLGVGGAERVHMLVRAGWADPVGPAPRRPLAALLRQGGAA